MNTDVETKKVADALGGPAYVDILHSRPEWILPNGTIKGWRCVIEHKNTLSWVNCYDKDLAFNRGMQEVEFYRNSRNERSIRMYRGK